jgi:hypothetical protein
MTVTLIFLLVIFVLALLVLPFMRQVAKDKIELSQTSLRQKFEVLFVGINAGLMEGKGEVITFEDDPRAVNMFDKNLPNMLIQFYYSTANLAITLNYKCFQKELVFKKDYPDLRNITVFQQKDIANDFVFEASKKINEHRQHVGSAGLDSPYSSAPEIKTSVEDDPTALLTGTYSGLSLSQKRSIANLMYIIGSADGLHEKAVISKHSFGMQLTTMKVKWDECKKQLADFGEQRIYEDLKNLDEGIMTPVILAILALVTDEIVPGQSMPNQQRVIKFFECFQKLGYSEERIDQIIQKIMLLSEQFGIG